MNPAGVQLLGYASEAALLAEPGRALRTPALAPADWAALGAGARHGGPRETETELVQPDGGAFRARIELMPFQVDEAPYLLVRIARQSRLRRAEEELAQSVRRYEAVFANATIGILVCDRAGAIVSANQVAHEQFGYAPDALAGQRIEVLVPNAASRRHVQLREGFNAAPQVRGMSAHRRDLEGLRRNGSVFPVEVSLSYFHLDDELYAVAYVQDITLQFNANRDLLAGAAHPDTATATEDTLLLSVPAADFTLLLLRDPAVSQRFVRLLVGRTPAPATPSADADGLALRRPLADILLHLHEQQRGLTPTDALIRLSPDDLATLLGTSPETLGRALRELRQDGLLEVTNEYVRVQQPERLKLRREGW